MKKTKIAILIAVFSLSAISSLIYLDYQNNPINYIILKRKFEIISYLFFRDIPEIYPTSNIYRINYERMNHEEDQDIDYKVDKSISSFSILDVKTVYETKIPQKLRKIFDDYAKLNPEKAEDRKIIENVMGTIDPKGRVLNLDLIFHGDIFSVWNDEKRQEKIKEYINLFSRKFIATSITKHKYDEGCGKDNYSIRIIVDSKPAKSLDIGLTKTGKICYLYDEEQIFPVKEWEIKNFKMLKYKEYWL